MQEAAHAALISKDAQPATAAGRHGVRVRAKTAFHEILGAKASAAKKDGLRDASAVKAALLKTLENGGASGKAHADGLAGKKATTARIRAPRIQTADGDPFLHQQHLAAKTVLDAAEQKKKALRSAHHADGHDLENSAAGASAALGIKNLPKIEKNAADASKAASADQVVSIHQAAARKSSEMRLHVVDARKKHADGPAEDLTEAAKGPKVAAQDRAAAPVVITRDAGGTESSARETRKGQGPVTQSTFAGALERLREMAGSELTRAAGIILRDGGGEIKLTLKPESLGSVRIRMNLVDNAIEGRIIVDNTAVKHIFEGSLDSLMRALTAEGFQTASLQVSVGGQNADNGRQDKEPLPRIRRVEASSGTVGAGMDWNVPGVENLSMGDLLVNLFV